MLCFWTVVLEKTLESPLDCKEIKPVNPKENQPWIFIGRTDADAEASILWPPDVKIWLFGKDPDAGKDWRPRNSTPLRWSQWWVQGWRVTSRTRWSTSEDFCWNYGQRHVPLWWDYQLRIMQCLVLQGYLCHLCHQVEKDGKNKATSEKA